MSDAATAEAATETLVVERDLPFPPERVWRALTDSVLIADWLMPNDFLPEPRPRLRRPAVLDVSEFLPPGNYSRAVARR